MATKDDEVMTEIRRLQNLSDEAVVWEASTKDGNQRRLAEYDLQRRDRLAASEATAAALEVAKFSAAASERSSLASQKAARSSRHSAIWNSIAAIGALLAALASWFQACSHCIR